MALPAFHGAPVIVFVLVIDPENIPGVVRCLGGCRRDHSGFEGRGQIKMFDFSEFQAFVMRCCFPPK